MIPQKKVLDGVPIAKLLVFLRFFSLCVFSGVFSGSMAAASDGLHSFFKFTSPSVEPNVLFFIDTSGAMLWPMDAPSDERDPKSCTFGDGTPGWKQGHKFRQEYFGRDIDPSNNDLENPDNYHPKLIWRRGGSVKADNSDELMPNDSRAYKLKLILWRILSDKHLVSGIRLGLATYMQTFVGDKTSDGRKVGLEGDWYRYPHDKVRIPNASTEDVSPGYSSASDIRRYRYMPTGSYNDPDIGPGTDQEPKHYENSWQIASGAFIGENEKSRRGLLRSDFRSFTKEDGSIDEDLLNTKFLRWIDGVEEYSNVNCTDRNYALETENPEIRFNGWCPLAETIYYRDGRTTNRSTDNMNVEGRREGSIDQFFTLRSGSAPLFITNYCQDQWVVIMTSGGQSKYAGTEFDPVEAVKELYNTRISMEGKQSQPIRAIVLGFVDPESTAPQIVSLRNQLNRMADMGDDGTENSSATAYFATDVSSVMKAMRQILTTIKTESGTNNAPLLSPSRATADGDVFYQATYTAYADACWKGDLEKIAFDGEKYPQIWSAAEKLQNTPWNERTVYIPALSGLTPAHHNLALFSTDAADVLAPVLGISSSLATNFIQWFLGDNIYEEVERYRLFDIYHSGIVKVGPPDARIGNTSYREFMTTYRDRPAIVYAQSNAGLLHAFDDGDGKERWAFIPPNALVAGRLRGLKWNDALWNYDTTKKSYSRYITDGPIVAEDVVIDGEYRTILLGFLGLGGAGMYAVDITDVDAPRFLWAVENDIYKEDTIVLSEVQNSDLKTKSDRNVRVWRRNAHIVEERALPHDKDIEAAWDYRDLRFTVSTPFIGSVGNEWVFLMGNGTSRGEKMNTGEIYVGNIGTGEIIKKLSPKSNNADSFVSPVAVIFEGVRKKIQRFFIADSSGMIFMGDISSTNTADWTLGDKEVFSVPGNVGFSYSLEAAKFDGNYWLFAGTGDWRNYLVNQSVNNYFVALNLKDLSRNTIPQFNDLDKLDAENASSSSLSGNGWYIQFPKDEYLSSPPVVYNGYVFFATFTKANDPCSPTGTAKIYAMKGTVGTGGWDGNIKYIQYANVRVSGIGFMGGKILFGATSFEGIIPPLPFSLPQSVCNNEAVSGSKMMIPLYWKGR